MWKKSSKSNLRTLPNVKIMKNKNGANDRINTTNIDLTFSYIKLSLKLLEFKWEKVIILQLFVNATSIKTCFSMTTFYIGFCHYQLHQMLDHFTTKLHQLHELYQPLLRKQINFGAQLERGRVRGFPCLLLKIDKTYSNIGKNCIVRVHLRIKFSLEMQF